MSDIIEIGAVFELNYILHTCRFEDIKEYSKADSFGEYIEVGDIGIPIDFRGNKLPKGSAVLRLSKGNLFDAVRYKRVT